jgi:tetratricopeptide (TPR) repeat protein
MKIAKIAFLVLLIGAFIFILTYKKTKDTGKANAYFKQGKQFFEAGKIDDAIGAYEKGLDADSTSSEGYNLLGMAYRSKYMATKENGFLNKAISAFEKSIDRNPKNWLPYVNLGTTYYYTKNKKKAVPYFKKSLEVNPENIEAMKIHDMIAEGEKEK